MLVLPIEQWEKLEVLLVKSPFRGMPQSVFGMLSTVCCCAITTLEFWRYFSCLWQLACFDWKRNNLIFNLFLVIQRSRIPAWARVVVLQYENYYIPERLYWTFHIKWKQVWQTQACPKWDYVSMPVVAGKTLTVPLWRGSHCTANCFLFPSKISSLSLLMCEFV